MHGAAVNADAVSKRSLMRVETTIGGEQRGMDIDHAVAPGIDQLTSHDPHEAGAGYKIDLVRLETCIDGAVERGLVP